LIAVVVGVLGCAPTHVQDGPGVPLLAYGRPDVCWEGDRSLGVIAEPVDERLSTHFAKVPLVPATLVGGLKSADETDFTSQLLGGNPCYSKHTFTTIASAQEGNQALILTVGHDRATEESPMPLRWILLTLRDGAWAPVAWDQITSKTSVVHGGVDPKFRW